MAGGDGSLAPVAQVALDAGAGLLESVPQALRVLVPAR
jgi:hypothetical protein